jgi:hypothetical protein
VPPAEPSDLPAFSLLTDPSVVGAVLEAIPLERPILPDVPRHVRNFEYRVRWLDQPHSENSIEPYLLVWHTTAFDEFIRGSGLTHHVPPTAYAFKHRLHVNQLLHREQPDRAVALVDPSAVQAGRPLAVYLPDSLPASAAAQSVSSQQSAALSFQSHSQSQ